MPISLSRRIARVVLQIILGVVIFGSALGKSLDFPGFVRVLDEYRAVPPGALWPVAIAVTVFEGFLGAWLLCGLRRRDAAWVSVAMNAAYAMGMTVTLLRGLHLENCGCFGVFLARPLTWESPLEDLAMIALSLALVALSTRTPIAVAAEPT